MTQNQPLDRVPLLVETPETSPGPDQWTFCRVRPSALGEPARKAVEDVVRDAGILADPYWSPEDGAPEGATERVLDALDAAWGAPGVDAVFEEKVPLHFENCLHGEEWGFWAVLEDDSVGRTDIERYGLDGYRDELYHAARLVAERIVGDDVGALHAVTVGAFVEAGHEPSAVARDLRRS